LSRRLPGLREYYLLEGLNALGTNVFFLGIFFHARAAHGFSDTANLLLAATQGAAYVLATRAGGRFADRAGVDRSIACGLAGMCLAAAAGWWLRPGWALFVAIAGYSASSALTWPALEAAIALAPGRASLEHRTGLYNIVWSLVGAAGFFLSGSLFVLDADAVFWVPLAAHLLQLGGLAVVHASLRGVSPAAERDPAAGRHAPAGPALPSGHAGGRERLLRSARVANGLNYFFFGAFTALAPTLAERLGLGPRLGIWLVSMYLFSRSAAFLLLWLWTGWVNRLPWLAAALLLPPAAFAWLFLSTSPAAAVGALAVLGAMSGVAYAASLRASLDRDGSEGEGGGVHEWVIGVGILLGPVAGAAGTGLLANTARAGIFVAALGAATALAGLAQLARRPPAG